MVLSGHQPNYWPYPGLLGKIMKSDKFMYVTNVQFEKKSWQKRNRIRTKDGWIYLKVPTITKGKYYQNISDVEIDNTTDWKTETIKTIGLLYGKAPFYKEYKDFLEDLYLCDWKMLSELNIYIMNFLLEELDSTTEIIYDKQYELIGSKTEMLVDMCKKTGCDIYLSNIGSAAYVEIEKFIDDGLNHMYIDYVGENYKQQFGGYEPNLSVLDMLLNCGKEKTQNIILNESNYRVSRLNEDLYF